tara:strand:+ start:9235 stop:9981 length:747 start_codon:yes stop_codon:yes gene_type:complete
MSEKVMFDPYRTTPILGDIPAWSFNRLKTFEECQYRLFLQVVKKQKELQENDAAIRGKEVHSQAEQFIKGETDTIPDAHLKKKTKLLERLQEKRINEPGTVLIEEQWGFNIDWHETGFFAKDVWCRLLLDVLEFIDDETQACAIDWKTGGGSDIAKFKYADQMMTYAVITLLKYPKLQFIETRLVFTDKDMPDLVQRYTREQAMLMLPKLEQRALALTTATTFSPNPSRHNCRFCPYTDGRCEWAHEE